MTLEAAIARARTLDFLAREGWPETAEFPGGFEVGRVLAAATEVLDVIDGHLAALEPGERAGAARAIKSQVDGAPPHAATVARRRAR